MPPIPHPGARVVRFDDAAAREAGRLLDDLADQLDAIARTERDRVGGCTAEWRGPSRTWFDRAHATTRDQVSVAALRAREGAAAMRRAIGAAATLQHDLNDEARRAEHAEVTRLSQLAAGGAVAVPAP